MAPDHYIGQNAGSQGTRIEDERINRTRTRTRHPNEQANPSNANRYAAAVLRGLDERIDRLENINREDAVPNILRAATEPVNIFDPVTVTVNAADPLLTWDDETATDSTWDTTGKWA